MPIPLPLAGETGRYGNLPARQREDLLQGQRLKGIRGRHRHSSLVSICIGAHLHTHLHIPEHTHTYTHIVEGFCPHTGKPGFLLFCTFVLFLGIMRLAVRISEVMSCCPFEVQHLPAKTLVPTHYSLFFALFYDMLLNIEKHKNNRTAPLLSLPVFTG